MQKPITIHVVASIALLLSFHNASAVVLVDRAYRLGEDDPSSVGAVTVSYDSAGVSLGQDEFIDVEPDSGTAPTYINLTSPRPDGVAGVAASFDGSNDYLRGLRLGDPSTSITSEVVNNYDFSGATGRGMQFWVRPNAISEGTPQSLVVDTNQHGVRINEAGNYTMRFAGNDYDSGVAAASGVWAHLMVLYDSRLGGSRMYVDGIARAAVPGAYDVEDTADLVLGANTGGNETLGGFTGGTGEFFSGLLDDLELFVVGDVRGPNPTNGNQVESFNASFDFSTDHTLAVGTLSGVLGDFDGQNGLDEADRQAFIAGWNSVNLVNGQTVGDLGTYATGDINFDGVNDLRDVALFQQALAGTALAPITQADLIGVPEPTGVVSLALLLAVGLRRHVRHV